MKAYIAYGSNMDEEQMKVRCPGAKLIGTGILEGWRLMYKGSGTGAYATIEREEGQKVPVVLWDITAANEKALDRYEGFPRFYYKVKIPVVDVKPRGEGTIIGMAYVMHEERKFGLPVFWYWDLLERAYERFGFDQEILYESLRYSEAKMAKKLDKIYRN